MQKLRSSRRCKRSGERALLPRVLLLPFGKKGKTTKLKGNVRGKRALISRPANTMHAPHRVTRRRASKLREKSDGSALQWRARKRKTAKKKLTPRMLCNM